jgi:preprotein translocase subunit SecD
LPNVFGDDRALQIARKDREPVTDADSPRSRRCSRTRRSLQEHRHRRQQHRAAFDEDASSCTRATRQGREGRLTKDYVNAMMYASRAPRWMQAMHLRAMPLGLDLRGGLYLLYEVDIDAAVEQLVQSYEQDFRARCAREHPVHRHQRRSRSIRTSQRPARAAAGRRGSSQGARRDQKAQPDLACRDATSRRRRGRLRA